MGGAVWGVCDTQSGCMGRNGGYVLCGSTPDTADCTNQPGTACCLSTPDAGGGIPSSYCAASCPAGTPPACNETNDTCPNGGVGWTCTPIPGVPVMALGMCVPTPDAGGGEGGTTEGGTGDDGGGAPETGAGDGATDAPAE
jgi:hypothetical protein